MTCDQTRPLLSAYVDRELEATRSLEIATHLQECGGCASVWQQYEALRSSLGTESLVFAPPGGLERRIRQALHRNARPRARFHVALWRWAPVPLAAALAAALSWSVAIQRAATSDENLVLAELVSGHVRSLMVDHLVDVASSDRHTVKPWFNGKVDFAPPVMDFAGSGFPLVGGRVDYIAERPVAVLVYKCRQHFVNVFIWPDGRDEGPALRNLTSHGYHLAHWSSSGLTFWAVSDVSSADLEGLARLFRDSG
jgi:anti-sigma factor RsiW